MKYNEVASDKFDRLGGRSLRLPWRASSDDARRADCSIRVPRLRAGSLEPIHGGLRHIGWRESKSDADDLLLLVCSEGGPGLDLSFHPADQSSLSESAEATLVFDGGAPVDAGMRAAAVFKNILFLLPDRDPNFGLVIEKLMSSKTVEIAIVESGTARSRHTFTLNGAAEAIAPALKLCGR